MKSTIAATLALATLATIVPSAAGQASLYHERLVSRGVSAVWDSCAAAAVGERCTLTDITADQESVFVKDPADLTGTLNYHGDCVRLSQFVGEKTDSLNPTGLVAVTAQACRGTSVNVPDSLVRARVQAELPAQRCDLTAQPETCVDTTVRVSLAWHPNGEAFDAPNGIERVADPFKRCQYHYLPGRFVRATATGSIDGLAGPLGDPAQPYTYMGVGGEIWLGTSHDCLD